MEHEDHEVDGIDVAACRRCPALCDSRSQIVNGTGAEDASLLFVGEGPGAREDEQGEPFVGRSGDVLTAALRDTGVDRGTVRIANCVRCRPPDNRDPTMDELANCREHLEREIEEIDPELIVTLGKVPSQHLLERDVAVTKDAGSVIEHPIAGTSRRLMVCVHPAATLYDPNQQETFTNTIETAVSLAGVVATGGQTRLDEY